jgi:dTDP-4-amino-4,6-dideoxygalactose transaminase
MKVPFLDLAAAHTELREELEASVLASLRSGWYIGGPEVETFEVAFAAFVGAKHCVGVANGLDALHLSLLAMGISHGDEVIVPSNTYIATWLAVTHCGAVPIPVEPDALTYNIDPSRLERAITKRTKAIIPVHLYGQPANLDPIVDVCRNHGLQLLEDGAQAHGARYKQNRIGGHGNSVAWSFYPGKNLGAAGDAGAVTTNDSNIAERIRELRNYGSNVKYVNNIIGFNSRLDPVQATVLRVKLKILDEWNSRRSAIANRYRAELRDCGLQLPVVLPEASPVWHLFVVQHERRDALQSRLAAAGVSTLIHYPIPPHLQKAYRDLNYAEGAFPIAERMAKQLLSLPIGPHMDDAAVSQVIDAVRAALKHD